MHEEWFGFDDAPPRRVRRNVRRKEQKKVPSKAPSKVSSTVRKKTEQEQPERSRSGPGQGKEKAKKRAHRWLPPTDEEVLEVVEHLPKGSFLRLICMWAYKASDTPLLFSLMTGLAALEMSAKNIQVASNQRGKSTNIYLGVIGDSGLDRKTWITEEVLHAHRLASHFKDEPLGSIRYVPWKALPEVQDTDNLNPYGFCRDPSTPQGIQSLLATLDTEHHEPKSLIYFPEGEVFFQDLEDYARFKGWYMAVYDGGGGGGGYTKGKEGRVVLPATRVSLVVAATTAHIQEHVTASMFSQGFYGRFLWAAGAKTREYLRQPSGPEHRRRYERAVKALAVLQQKVVYRRLDMIHKDDRIPDAVQDAYSLPLYAVQQKLSRKEKILAARSDQYLQKVTRLLALNDGDSRMRVVHGRLAWLIVQFSIRSSLYLHQITPNSDVDRQVQVVIHALDELASVTITPDGRKLRGTRRVPVFTVSEIWNKASEEVSYSLRVIEETLTLVRLKGFVKLVDIGKKPGSDKYRWTQPRREIKQALGGESQPDVTNFFR